jgi:hypothetical protein
MTPDASNIPQFLEQLRQSRFYGSLEIKLEAGRIVLLKKTETIKPAEEHTAVSAQSKHSGANHGNSQP